MRSLADVGELSFEVDAHVVREAFHRIEANCRFHAGVRGQRIEQKCLGIGGREFVPAKLYMKFAPFLTRNPEISGDRASNRVMLIQGLLDRFRKELASSSKAENLQ